MRRKYAALLLILGLWSRTTDSRADDGDWRPTSPPRVVARSSVPAQPSAPVQTAPVAQPTRREVVAATRPSAATIGRPIVKPNEAPPTVEAAAPTRVVFRAQAPDTVTPGPSSGPIPGPAPGTDLFNNGAVTNPTVGNGGSFPSQVGGFCKELFHRNCGQPFQSDHGGDLDQFASPVSNPFLFEDPRSLTEIKPLFIYQNIPTSNPNFAGGDIEFFGLQARIAFTECLSLVINKFGGIAFQPENKNFGFDDQSGFAEVWFGPKYVFYRDEQQNTIAAAGLMFQVPTGSSQIAQDTGSLSLAPYLSFAKSFGKLPNGYGNFNYMSTTGFSFGIDSQRSDYFYSSFHLDFDVAGQHKYYPLIELNWIRNINGGDARPLQTFEGGDLINFGAGSISEKNFFTLATGLRYKFSECIQVGGAAEFPLSKNKDFNDFRLTFDVIFRY